MYLKHLTTPFHIFSPVHLIFLETLSSSTLFRHSLLQVLHRDNGSTRVIDSCSANWRHQHQIARARLGCSSEAEFPAWVMDTKCICMQKWFDNNKPPNWHQKNIVSILRGSKRGEGSKKISTASIEKDSTGEKNKKSIKNIPSEQWKEGDWAKHNNSRAGDQRTMKGWSTNNQKNARVCNIWCRYAMGWL